MIGTPRAATAAKPRSKSLEDKYYARNIPKRPKRATSSRRRNHLCIVTGADGLPRRRIAKADNMDDIEIQTSFRESSTRILPGCTILNSPPAARY